MANRRGRNGISSRRRSRRLLGYDILYLFKDFLVLTRDEIVGFLGRMVIVMLCGAILFAGFGIANVLAGLIGLA